MSGLSVKRSRPSTYATDEKGASQNRVVIPAESQATKGSVVQTTSSEASRSRMRSAWTSTSYEVVRAMSSTGSTGARATTIVSLTAWDRNSYTALGTLACVNVSPSRVTWTE